MKKGIKLMVMLMVMSSLYATTTFAQTGTAFFRPKYEYVMDPDSVWGNFKNNYLNAFGKGDLTCFDRIQGETQSVSAATIVHTIAARFKSKGGVPNITGSEIAQMFADGRVTYDVVGSDYWLTHESAYFDTKTGQVFWHNPTKTSIPELKNRKQWVIVHFHFPAGIVDVMGHCSNFVRAISYNPGNGEEHFVEKKSVIRATYNTDCSITYFTVMPQASDGPGQEVILSWSTTCPTVTISGFADVLPGSGQLAVRPNQTTTYILTTSSGLNATVTVAVLGNYGQVKELKQKSWFGRNWGWVVAGTAAVVAGTLLLTHGHGSPSGGNHTYDNGFQGGSGSSGASGGSGGQQTWFQRPVDVVALYNF